jgi:hypothetical protein
LFEPLSLRYMRLLKESVLRGGCAGPVPLRVPLSRTSWRIHCFPISMICTSGPREIFAMNPRFECCLHKRDILPKADRISAAASSPVSDDDVMLKKRILAAMTACFSSWLPNSVVAGNDDPAVQAGFSEPDDIFRALRKELVVDADLDTGGAERLGHFLSAQRSVDEEYEGLRRLSPAGARSGPLPRC